MATPHTCPVCQGTRTMRNPDFWGHTGATPTIPCLACHGLGVLWQPQMATPLPIDELLNLIAGEARLREKAEQRAAKTLDVTSSKDFPGKVGDVEVFGNPDLWRLVCKASSKSQGWMKSTKVMELPNVGVVLQVTTQQGDHVAEALCFIPASAPGALMKALSAENE